MINAVLRLRRDNDYNYAKIKDTFIPMKGEICLVDTSNNGLRAVCGDGRTPFGKLDFMNDFIKKGYFKNDLFYSNKECTEELPAYSTNLYIDLFTSRIYYCFEDEYRIVETGINLADSFLPGIMKLYNTVGQNVDGTMTQKAITNELNEINEELNEKVEISLEKDEEVLIFTF